MYRKRKTESTRTHQHRYKSTHNVVTNTPQYKEETIRKFAGVFLAFFLHTSGGNNTKQSTLFIVGDSLTVAIKRLSTVI